MVITSSFATSAVPETFPTISKPCLAYRGLAMWYNIALITFFAITISVTATIINSGVTTSDATKEVVEEAMTEARHGLEIVGLF